MIEDLYHVCPKYERAVEVLGKRWTGLILRVLGNGPTTFSKIAKTVSKLSDRVLSERLKELERHGIVERQVDPSIPVKITYSLTEKGRDLQQVLDVLQAWADRWETSETADAEFSSPVAQA
ncbi:MAG: helix-turn-helix transcriptional regulator [Chloroflexota bacterium]|nr:helix-turn-helix transcriptional regulator [Chloroflexota bacterium]